MAESPPAENEFLPRDYQTELMKIALEKNTIIYLPTGAGKTFIAVMVLRQMSAPLAMSWDEEGGKISILLVNTVALVQQHGEYLERHIPFAVGQYTGEHNLDFWNAEIWNEQCRKNRVLVMTCQILSNALDRSVIDLQKINLIIFDECHRGVLDHSMRQVMKMFQHCEQQPRVLGLTATLLNKNCKPDQVEKHVELLETTYHSQVVTVDELETVLGYSTNPQERLIYHPAYSESENENRVIANLNKLIKILQKTHIEDQHSPKRTNRDNSIEGVNLNPDKGLKKLANLVSDVVIHINMLGTYGGIIAITSHMIQIECIRRLTDNVKLYHALNTVITALTLARRDLSTSLTGDVKEDIYKLSSPKVLSLLAILKMYKKTSKQELCGIIFVHRRFTAKVLFHMLSNLAENFEEFAFVRPNFIVGHNCNPYNNTREAMYLNKIQREIIMDFYAKNYNLIVASNVLEEGVDVPTCSLVIKFDPPMEYRAYIQSKGRARHPQSLYYIMIENTEQESYKDRYANFKHIEKALNQLLIGRNDVRNPPNQSQIEAMYNEDEIPPYYVAEPGSAQINMVNACSLLSSYCNSMVCDPYTQYAPNWTLDFQHPPQCRVTIEMPTSCPYLDPIAGRYMPNKRLAKRACAMKACEILHRLGELDNNLRPIKVKELDKSTDFLFAHHIRNPDRKNKDHYKIKLPDSLVGQLLPNTPINVHVIHFTPRFSAPADSADYVFQTKFAHSLSYAILTPNRLPTVCDFPVYVSQGEIMVHIETNFRTVTLDEQMLNDVKCFTHFVYTDILKVLKPYLAVSDESNVLITAWDKNQQCISMMTPSYQKPKQLTPAECFDVDVSEGTCLGQVYVPFYREDFNNEYIVTKVCTSMSPLSQFPAAHARDFYEYFRDTYRYHIQNHGQPLFEVKAISSRLYCTKPRGPDGKKSRENKHLLIHLVPEMVTKQTFPSSLWLQAKLLPTVLEKFVQLLRAEELRNSIVRGTRIGLEECDDWLPLTLDTNEVDTKLKSEDDTEETQVEEPMDENRQLDVSSIMKKMNREIEAKTIQSEYPWEKKDEPVDIERNLEITPVEIRIYADFINKVVTQEYIALKQRPSKYLALTYNKDFAPRIIDTLRKGITKKGPELGDIFKALSTAKANDLVNLERLETLGDSFLKFAAALYIILRFPKFNEGKSAILKDKLVCNENLFRLGLQRNIPGYLKVHQLQPRDDWTPPGFSLPNIITSAIRNTTSLTDIALSHDEQLSGRLSSATEEIIRKEFVEQFETDIKENMSTMRFLGNQFTSKKAIADCCEAILGACVEGCGIPGGLRCLEWLGVIPQSEGLSGLLSQELANPVLNPKSTSRSIDLHIPQYKQLEESLGYTFKNRAYLLQAMTHASYSPNRITANYQRLEYLGDAILDFLITSFIYENSTRLSPGDLTDLRSALVNNVTFACFSVRCGFHKHLLAMNFKLQSYVDRFIRYQENKNFAIDDEVLILLNEDDFHISEYVDVPKVLGDIFEALAGAVYLDSGMNLETVWEVFYRIMWKEIEKFTNNVPKNSVRVLYETPGAHPKFYKPKPLDDGKMMMKLDIMINGELTRVHGFGDNKKHAKKAAAKIALRLLGK